MCQVQSFPTASCLPSSEDTLPALSASPSAIQLFRDHWLRPFSFSCIQECLLSGWLPPSRWQAHIAGAHNTRRAPQPPQLLSSSQAALIPLEEMVACRATQMPCSVFMVSSCSSSQEVIPRLTKNKTKQRTEQVQESFFLVPYMPTGCWYQLCQTPLRHLRPEVLRETQLCLPWAVETPGSCCCLGHHRKGQFFFLLGKRNMLFQF